MMDLDPKTKATLRTLRGELIDALVRLDNAGDAQRKIMFETMQDTARRYLKIAESCEFETEDGMIRVKYSELIPDMAASLAFDILKSLTTEILSSIEEP